MAERHPGGFLEAHRQAIGYRDVVARLKDYAEIYAPNWHEGALRTQGERCMDCGLPTCMGSCPIANLVPEWNDLVSRGRWHQALVRLHATNNFPEFTGYTCPAPCEPACVLAIGGEPVTIKSIERAIVDKGWEEGWIVPEPPRERTGLRVAIVGSGPAGLAAAQQLNRCGHHVTVFERDDAIGGLLTYGIPDFKLAKHRVARRVAQLGDEGIEFRTGVHVGVNCPLEALEHEYDAVCLAIGALDARDIEVPGRNLAGIELAMTYLVQANRRLAGHEVHDPILTAGRRVVVLGGGDTGADCVATANRQGAQSVTQVDINLARPRDRPPDNPWPLPPVTSELTYAQAEGCVTEQGFETTAFAPAADGVHVRAVTGNRVSWTYTRRRRRVTKTVLAEGVQVPADLVLIAAGFRGPEMAPFAGVLAVEASGVIATDHNMMTSRPGMFAAGDANMGQSIVVWAIGEGRDVARAIDRYLTGATTLPASIRTRNAPTQWCDQVEDRLIPTDIDGK